MRARLYAAMTHMVEFHVQGDQYDPLNQLIEMSRDTWMALGAPIEIEVSRSGIPHLDTPLRTAAPESRSDEKSHIQRTIDETLEQYEASRQKVLTTFLDTPGLVATFGNDFDLEVGDVEVNSIQPLDDIDLFKFSITQQYRVRRRTNVDSDEADAPAQLG